MITLKPISVEDLVAFRATRLAALQDTPTAFGSTYAKESRLTEADWLARIAHWNGPRSICYLAWEEQSPCGIAACYFDAEKPRLAHLVSMWVAPSHRRRRVGHQLVTAVVEWAQSLGAEALALNVTSNNDAAMRFYESLNFRYTERTEPYVNDPSLLELEMIHRLV